MTLVMTSFNEAAPRNSERTRWGVSLLIAVTLHAMGALSLLHWRDHVMPIEPVQTVTMIDLAPLPTPPAPPVVQPPPPQPPVEQHIEPPKPVVVQKVTPKPAPHPAVSRPEPQVQPQAAPPQAAAPTVAPTPASVPTSNAVPTYKGLISAQLERFKRYPALSQKRGEQGVPMLRFTLDRRGNVLKASLELSSGHDMLDKEAVDLANRAAPFPPMPADLPGDTLELIVPIQFKLG